MTTATPTRTRPIDPRRHAARVARLQAAQPLWTKGYDRQTGERVAFVPSQTAPGKYHRVTSEGCDCRGFQYRGQCSHYAAAMPGARERAGVA